MESKKIVHLLHVPWTGLGLYNGYRGDAWLKNRIKIFKQFVVPSLQSQTSQEYTLWCAWRYEERNNPLVKELKTYLDEAGIRNVFTYHGICFYDDKYPDDVAINRLINSIHGSMGELFDVIGDADEVLMTIQPSDDCYCSDMVRETQAFFLENKDIHVYGYAKGYVMDYVNWRLSEWNPKTTPPFYTIRFPRDIFTDPLKHVKYIGPYTSHEYVKDFLPALYVEKRGFIVGTHGCNISTVFDHPYAGYESLGSNITIILSGFGLSHAGCLQLPFSIRNKIFMRLPYSMKRKLRFWASEKKWILRPLFSLLYNFLRS